jgi:hypothetical protein
MSNGSFTLLKTLTRLTLAALLFNLSLPLLSAQSVLDSNSPLAFFLNLTPTSVEVTPTGLSVNEGSGPVQFTATAKYQYPGLTTPIPDRNVTNDALTTWQSSSNDVAIVNTIGSVTPVSDLGTGNSPAVISATFGGVTGQSTINVVGPLPPPAGGSGGGSGSSSSGTGSSSEGTSSSGETSSGGEEAPSGEEQTPSGEEQTPPGEEQTPSGEEQTPSGEEQTPPGEEQTPTGEEQTPSGEEQTPSGEQQTASGEEQTSSTSGEQTGTESSSSESSSSTSSSPDGFIISQPPADTSYLPLERPYTEEELKAVEEIFDLSELTTVTEKEGEVLGTSRIFATVRIQVFSVCLVLLMALILIQIIWFYFRTFLIFQRRM